MREFLFFWTILLLLVSNQVKGQFLLDSEKIVGEGLADISRIDVADLDGDEDQDVIIGYENEIFWFENDGSGGILDTKFIATLGAARIPKAADVSGNGVMDIVVQNIWCKNSGNGVFATLYPITANLVSVSLPVEINGDGDMDMVSSDNENLNWHKNKGNGYFGSASQSTEILIDSEGKKDILAVDIDQDGDADLLTLANRASTNNQITWYINDGAEGFMANTIETNNTQAIAINDMDNDGDIDVLASLVLQDDKSQIVWYENDGTGNFTGAKNILNKNHLIEMIFVEDFDRDGKIDLLLANNVEVTWVKGEGAGQFNESEIIFIPSDYILNIAIADMDSDQDMDVIIATNEENTGLDKVIWIENLRYKPTIFGFTYYDLNENGIQDEGEKSLSNQKLLLQPLGVESFTNKEGFTSFVAEYGEYQLAYIGQTLWEISGPDEIYNIIYQENTDLPIYNFGIKPTRTLHRVSPRLNGSATRCSTEASYWLTYSNTGSTFANGTITLEVDALMNFISSNPPPDAIEGRNLIWHFEDLPPTYENKIKLQFQMPNFNSMGEILETQASLQLFNENEELVYSKSTDYNSEVLCSYDPNDKLVRSNLLGQSETAYITDTLLYTVRFQNTGNDVAFNIRIEDVLDKRLDWTTFHPITASHDYRTELNRETGLVTFYFDNIMLSDSTTNEPESHGFVLFGIASLAELEDKTEVENTASIFFDFNPPIVTNTVSTVLIELDDVSIGNSILDVGYSILIRPNPFSDYTTIEVEGLTEGNYQLEVMDILGRQVRTLTLEEGKARLERGNLESGVYFFKVLEEGKLEVIGGGKVLVE